MTTQQDVLFGVGKESVFGTKVTVDHFYEITDETLDWVPTFTDTSGMRQGRIVKAADRRVLTKQEAGGSFDLELYAKGMGFLFAAALGTGVSTNITGAAFQQLISCTTSDYLSSYTLQVGVPPLGGGAQTVQTYSGCVFDGFDIKSGNAGIPTVKFTVQGKQMDTTTSLATAAYPAGNFPWSFVQGSIMVGGTLTLPTTTTLASGGTSAADIRDYALSWKNNLDKNGFNYGGSGSRSRPPAMGERAGTGTLTAEYDNTTLRDAWLNQTDLDLVLTFQSQTAITGSNYPTLQIVIPDIRLNGEVPKPNKGDVITQSIPFEVLDNRSAASPIYVAIVTAETAL
ncbi:phage tail tube protein [Leifsonia sp. NPDC056824]|uniref:phage tail tube protein n=1 Tax=Leifsonia sp. NPDC056824 TaxID=3345953 RepID=UPI00369E3F3E